MPQRSAIMRGCSVMAVGGVLQSGCMKPWQTHSLLLACLSLAAAPVLHAVAQEVNATGDYLARMDRDGDGRVSREEYLDWMSYAFDARDADRDGILGPAEQPGGRGVAISRAAHRQRLSARFDRQDVDRDGYLSARELAAPPR